MRRVPVPAAAAPVTQLWAEPEHPNLAAALGGYVGAGAPLVAGFELAAIVVLLTAQGVAASIPLVGPALVAMVVSASLMVLSIRYGFWAVSYWTTPAERLMWNPAAVVRMMPLDRERRRLAARMAHFRRLRRRAEHLFESGLIVFLAAVALILIPAHVHASGPGWRWAAAGCAAFALLIHLVWSAGTWLHEHLGRWYRRLSQPSAAVGGTTGKIRPRAAGVLAVADKVLVKCLVVIWPPVRAAAYDKPELPEAADLLGLRR